MQYSPFGVVPAAPTTPALLTEAPVLLPAVPPPRLVPRSVPEMLDESVRAVRRDFGLFVSVAAITVVPANLLSGAVTAFFVPFNPLDPFTYFRAGSHAAITSDSTVTFVLTVLLAIATAAINALGVGALVTVAGLRTLDQPCDPGAAYAHARRRYRALLGTSLATQLTVALLTGVSFFVASPFTLYLFVGWQLAPQAVTLEGQRPFAAMRRSLSLVRGGWWRFAGLQLMLLLLQAFATAVPAGLALVVGSFTLSKDLFGGVPGAVTLAVMSSLVNVVLLPVVVVANTLFFSDQRLRREGFDIDLLLQRGAAERASGMHA